MRIRRPRPREEPENMLPMINVVFLLLIFFMLLANFTIYIPFPVAPPDAEKSEVVPHEVMIAVAADGRIALDGREIDLSAVTSELREKRRNGPIKAVWINADKETDSDRVIDVMEQLHKAGVEAARLITKR